MCRLEKSVEDCDHRDECEMGMGFLKEGKVKKFRSSVVLKSGMKLWILRATTTALIWICVVQLLAIGETWGPRLLKDWPSCFIPADHSLAVQSSSIPTKVRLPPKSKLACEHLFHEKKRLDRIMKD